MAEFLAVPLGSSLIPIVDVTNPAFAVSPSQGELDALAAQFVDESQARTSVGPDTLTALAASRLGSGLLAARGTYLAGLSTYLLKLGPDNLPADFHPIDRRIAASFPSMTTRLRLQDMSTLLAEGLTAHLRNGTRPLQFVNVAGGPAADSWNALIRIRSVDAALLDRDVTVNVLDVDTEGPAFGARAFDALQSDGGPLHGVRVRFNQTRYDWTDSGGLRRSLGRLDLREAVCAISSEGGLFEYGSDDEIAENLTALGELTASDAIVVGSACRDCQLTRLQTGIGVAVRPRARDAFQALVERSGWRVETLIERPFSDHVRLVKRPTSSGSRRA